jgi:SWI/SNF-related matrix-associated actin-dependent regulator 1 of chromatin subfamily A
MPTTSSLYTAAANIITKSASSQLPPPQVTPINTTFTQSTTIAPSTQNSKITQMPNTPSYAVVRFSLVNTEEFTAKANGPVNKRVIDVMKKINGIRYDPETKRVIFPLEAHDILQVSLSSLRIGVEPLMRTTIAAATLQSSKKKALGQVTMDPDELLRERLPENVLASLADFQKEGVVFALHNDGRILIADEMGLGKTRQAIASIIMYREDWPVLIICPSSARYHWLHELTNLMCPTCINPNEIVLVENHHYSYNPTHQIVIVSYSIVQKLYHVLNSVNFNVTIADESHFLKNIKTQRSQSLIPLLKKSKRVLLLSGTPALSRPIELFTQLHVLAPTIWPDEKEYAKRYCRSSKGRYFSDYRGASNTQELHIMLSNTVMIRRLKKDVMARLPKKQRSIVAMKLTDTDAMARFK